MKRSLLLALSLVAASMFAAEKEEDWVKVTYPDAWIPGAPMKFEVTLKGDIPAGQLISVHMHWMKAKGFGGMLSYKPGQAAESGKTFTFIHKPKMKEGAVSASACIFLAPDADYKLRTKELKVGIPLDLKTPPPPEKPKWTPPPYDPKPDTVTYKKSQLWVEDFPKEAKVGEPFKVKVHYILDPSDTWGKKPTCVQIQPLGPWIDNPDGVVNAKRMHVGLPGLKMQVKSIEPGEGTIDFDFTITKGFRFNSLFFRCYFRNPDYSNWPWDWRGAHIAVEREDQPFEIEAEADGGLFAYGETPSFEIEWGKGVTAKSALLTIKDVYGKVVLEKTVARDMTDDDQTVRLDGFKERGCFSATLKVDGVGEEYCFFGTIPKFKRETGRRTPFGITNIYDDDSAELGAKLGFSYTRLFTTWKDIEPSQDRWVLDRLDRAIKVNTKNGLQPWICLYGPPAWALPEGMWSAGYEPSPFDLKAWSKVLKLLAERYNGQLYGFEWLNEIVPGKLCKDPVKEYVDICKTGYQTVKSVNPNYVCQLAGGLWPHNYRIDCLNAGVGNWIDLLPVHYSTFDGVITAKDDLALRGLDKKGVGVCDNETSKGMTTWNMKPEDALSKSIIQCHHVMTRWPDELCAGAKMIVFFGGSPDVCGNWSYLIDDKNPRPVAVTLAVVQEKLGYAKTVGKFYYDGCPIQLFERDGKAIAFVSAPGEEGREITLPITNQSYPIVTDYLGNVKTAQDGKFIVGDMPVIVENINLNVMKLCAAMRIGTSQIPAAEPQVVADADATISVPVTVSNPFDATKTFTITPAAVVWGASDPVEVTLAAGESKSLKIAYSVKAGAKLAPVSKLAMSIATAGITAQSRPFVLYVVDPAAIGNLIKDGDFEGECKAWKGGHELLAAAMPDDDNNKAMSHKGTGPKAWKSSWQSLDVPVPGQSYLYTCWMNSDDMFCGSNMSEEYEDGSKRNYIALRIFSIGAQGSKSWRYLAKRFDTKPNTTKIGLAPVGDGNGRFYVDNMSFSLYRGTDFAAFAGRVGGESKSLKIPLLCDNQIKCDGGYEWDPAKFGGVAEFSWDESSLILTCTVLDDTDKPVSIVSEDGTEALGGDMLAIALFPKLDASGMPTSEQERWYLSLASPGGGSGKTTLFRPKKYSLGLKSGQLAKDSSVYQVDFRREGKKTVYSLRIPWSEIPGFTPAKGASFGCNLVLIDGGEKGTGRMIWGVDLSDSASGCGIVTLLP